MKYPTISVDYFAYNHHGDGYGFADSPFGESPHMGVWMRMRKDGPHDGSLNTFGMN